MPTKLRSNLTKIALQCPEAAAEALLQTAADIVDITKQLAPVDTGALRQSYGAVPLSRTAVRIGSDMPYAGYVEYGTSRAGAQPHLTPAFHQADQTMRVRMKQAMQRLIDGA